MYNELEDHAVIIARDVRKHKGESKNGMHPILRSSGIAEGKRGEE